MRYFISLALTALISLAVSSCGDPADEYKQNYVPPVKQETELVEDYDNGTDIHINVKIAIDSKGWKSQTPEFFKEKLAEQWKQINARFNSCGQKGNVKLARKYTFEPDLDDILVYDGCSYWGENGADTKALAKMDKNLFKLVVIYDFFYEGAENGEYGGGCGDSNGIGTILVINASDGAKDKYNDHFDQYTYRAITHELGHFRGVIDLYAEVISAENNQVNHTSFMPISCLMNDKTYTTDDESAWSDYAVKIINKAGNKKEAGMIDGYMYNDFAKTIKISAKKDGNAVNAKINFYPQTGRYENGISSTAKVKYTLEDGGKEIDAKGLFFNNPPYYYDRTAIFLVEAEFEGIKKYIWLCDYMLHDSGMDGITNYKLDFEF